MEELEQDLLDKLGESYLIKKEEYALLLKTMKVL